MFCRSTEETYRPEVITGHKKKQVLQIRHQIYFATLKIIILLGTGENKCSTYGKENFMK